MERGFWPYAGMICTKHEQLQPRIAHVLQDKVGLQRLAQDIIVVLPEAASMSLSVDLAVAHAVGACSGAGQPACQVAHRAYDVQSSGDYASMRRGGRSRTEC